MKTSILQPSMMKMSVVAKVFLLVLAFVVEKNASAQESMSLGQPVAIPTITHSWGKWEGSLYWGHIIPLKKNTFSYDVPNSKVLDLLASEAVGDEVGEGFVAPPQPGNSTVAGTLHNFSEVGIQVFYQMRPWYSIGAQFGYGLKRDLYIDNRGIYNDNNFLKVEMQANIYHLNLPVRFGQWYGRFKPHVMVGPGLYFTQERVRLSFNDSDDQQLKPQYLIAHDTEYLGANLGAGLDMLLGERGRFSIECEYHKVFSPLGKFDFILPKASLSYAF